MDIQQNSQETKLKALLEDMGVGFERKALRAELTLRTYASKYEGITYDEAITLIKETEDIIGHMSPFDKAFEHMVTERNNLLRWAGAVNDAKGLGRHEHEIPIHALVSVNRVTVEVNFHIPRLYYNEHNRPISIKARIIEAIQSSSEWTGSRRFLPNELDFVEI